MEQTPDNRWKTWIDILQDDDQSIPLDARSKEDAEVALRKLLLQHFEPLVLMLK